MYIHSNKSTPNSNNPKVFNGTSDYSANRVTAEKNPPFSQPPHSAAALELIQ